MGFRLVPKSVTLNDLERRNDHVVCVISQNWLAFVECLYVKVVEDTLIHSASETQPEESSFQRNMIYDDIRRESPPATALKWSDTNVASENLTNNQP